MDAIIQSQLDRVEIALNTLVDSIAAHNPSITATTDLLVADDNLNDGVKQLAIHQSNYQKILRLREKVDNLNQSITSKLNILVDTRKQLLTAPRTYISPNQRKVPYNELLEYAKRISRYTVPPIVSTLSSTIDVARAISSQPAESSFNSSANIESSTQPSYNVLTSSSPDHREGIGISSLEQREVEWLKPTSQVPFVPWPSEEVIRQGALAQLQTLLEDGTEPKQNISGQGQPEDSTNEPIMNNYEEQNSYKLNPDESLNGVHQIARNGVASSQTMDEKPKVFGGLDLYDPEDEA